MSKGARPHDHTRRTKPREITGPQDQLIGLRDHVKRAGLPMEYIEGGENEWESPGQDRIVIPGASDPKGHSDKSTRFSMPPWMKGWVDRIVGHPDSPYRSETEFHRHAAHVLLQAWRHWWADEEFMGVLEEDLQAQRAADMIERERRDLAFAADVRDNVKMMIVEAQRENMPKAELVNKIQTLRSTAAKSPPAFRRQLLEEIDFQLRYLDR